MRLLLILLSNSIVNVCVIAWSTAQIIKTLLYWFLRGDLKFERLFGSGGMPSSHAAMVTSLSIGIARTEGFRSTLFALSLAFAAVVMYDAMGVRRAAGEQAKALNRMMTGYHDFWDRLKNHPLLEFGDDENGEGEEDSSEQAKRRALKEYLGHTPLEVLAGALLGILIAMIYPL
jgi:acid phosphatase family membrane protein YuiD